MLLLAHPGICLFWWLTIHPFLPQQQTHESSPSYEHITFTLPAWAHQPRLLHPEKALKSQSFGKR